MDKNIEPESKSTGQKKVRPGKNEWIDTAGYTHRYFVDPRKEISPRVTWSVLLLVTLLASIIGWFCVRDISPEKQSPRHVVQFPASGKIFMVRRPPITLKEDNPFLIATGQDNTFLIADSDEIAVYNLRGEKIKSFVWKNERKKVPTALLCVTQINHPLHNTILMAVGDEVLAFDAQEGTLVKDPVFSILDGRITDLAVDQKSVWAADIQHGEITRWDGENDFQVPSLTVGNTENERDAFPGFLMPATAGFSITTFPVSRFILATNPKRFQIEAFNRETGSWVPENSWACPPGTKNGFSGQENPSRIKYLPNGSILTTEYGKDGIIRLFDSKGELQAVLTLPKEFVFSEPWIPEPAVLNNDCILILTPNAQVVVFERLEH